MKENLSSILEKVLRKNENYIAEDCKILKSKVYEDAMSEEKVSKDLIKLLLSEPKIKESFFIEVEDLLVFDKQSFVWFINSKDFLPDSYTSFKNKIDLIDKNRNYISSNNDVVLAFPFKDCVLQGGQDKEEVANRTEIMYNEIIAYEDIRRMLAPKVFTKAKRYTEDRVEENIKFTKDDNLIIKGNNLIALSSILKIYGGGVKCIYIDPPYNTGSDGFNYNDKFNHSTWLTFMKNRLELAKKLLTDDGIIFVQCDDNEQAYLKVLMDNIFGRENFVNTISIRSSTPSGLKTTHRNRTIIKTKDYILVYSKSNDNILLKPQYVKKEKWDTHYDSFFDRNSMKVLKLVDVMIEKKLLKKGESLKEIDLNNKEHKKFYLENSDNIFRKAPEMPKAEKERSKNNRDQIISYESDGVIQYAINGNRFSFLKQTVKEILNNSILEEDISNLLCDFWNDIDFQNTQNQGGVDFANAKKPEQLIYRILDITTKPNDLVLDFHLGSGTTAAVAHKMGRRYIGIEQMDYIESITVERLKKVIAGEQGGISKALNWKGGGSFVYCELKENSYILLNKIKEATEENIKKVKDEIYKDERIIPYITREELEKANKDFENLKLEDKKKILIDLVDKNKLYVNYSDMEDEEYSISENEKIFTNSFYKGDIK